MKKFILGIIIFLFTPLGVNAANYEISNQYIKGQILPNGNLQIQELIVMDGSFNGYEKTLTYKNELLESNFDNYENNSIYNATSLRLVKIEGKYVNDVSLNTFNDTDFEPFTLVSNASNGSKALYTKASLSNGATYRLYYKANHQKVAFLITYILENAVVLHNDVAELYWNFITPNDYDDINDVKIALSLPGVDNSSNFRFWAHGDLSGEIKKMANNEGVIASIDYLRSSSPLDIRLTFQKELITDQTSIKTSNQEALPKIIAVEEKRAEEANNLRAKLLAKYNFVKYATIGLYFIIIMLFIFIYYKYGKSPKSSYYAKYNREFIDDYNVEIIDYLMKRKITPNAMSASIMNLIYKKNLSVEVLPTSKKKKDYIFTLENLDNINSSEAILIEFLFDKVGKKALNSDNKQTFTTLDLKKYASGTKTCNKFISSYTSWKNNVLTLSKKQNFFITSASPKLIGGLMSLICFFLLVFALQNGVDYFPTYLLIFFNLIFFVYTLLVYKKTQKGSDHYTKWQAFKNFLNDFGAFNLKELPEIVLWERYLVYATIFGLADKVEKSMNVHIKELELSEFDLDYYPSYIYINLGNDLNQSINSALNNAYSTQAASYANSHSSSSSGGGFGGGFSSGGGFGGGGSSGHGF